MIDNLTINFECDGISHTLNVPTKDKNLPYNLATAFAEIIKQSDANIEMVISNLMNKLPHERNSWYSVNYRLPPQDVVVIVLDNEGKISFAHRVDPTKTKRYDGWNIPGVRYWMSFNDPLKD